MAAKKIAFGTDARAAIREGVKKLAKAPFNIYEKDEVKEEFKESLTFEQIVKIAKKSGFDKLVEEKEEEKKE